MTHGKRGMLLEDMIERTNATYRSRGKALISKIPTPWNVSYDKKTGRVYRAFPERKGTVDFIGVSHSRSIAFDAKSTKERTRFPLSNIHKHQVDFLVRHQQQGGISFFIVYFEKLDEAYFLPIDLFMGWWLGQKSGGRKSIPYHWFVLETDRIQSRSGFILDYLANCDLSKQGKGMVRYGKNK